MSQHIAGINHIPNRSKFTSRFSDVSVHSKSTLYRLAKKLRKGASLKKTLQGIRRVISKETLDSTGGSLKAQENLRSSRGVTLKNLLKNEVKRNEDTRNMMMCMLMINKHEKVCVGKYCNDVGFPL